jgi:hypothetical protein
VRLVASFEGCIREPPALRALVAGLSVLPNFELGPLRFAKKRAEPWVRAEADSIEALEIARAKGASNVSVRFAYRGWDARLVHTERTSLTGTARVEQGAGSEQGAGGSIRLFLEGLYDWRWPFEDGARQRRLARLADNWSEILGCLRDLVVRLSPARLLVHFEDDEWMPATAYVAYWADEHAALGDLGALPSAPAGFDTTALGRLQDLATGLGWTIGDGLDGYSFCVRPIPSEVRLAELLAMLMEDSGPG